MGNPLPKHTIIVPKIQPINYQPHAKNRVKKVGKKNYPLTQIG